jgi:hypothetical protein
MDKKSNDYFEKHPSKLQFLINIILVVVTIFTLLSTWYFSEKNLALSTNQYKSTVDQFNYQRKVDSLKNITDSMKESKYSSQRISDSIIQSNKDKIQENLNNRQLNINKQELLTSESQAQTTKNQLTEQTEQYKEQSYERQPYFMINGIYIDSTIKYKPKISFSFSNKGVTPAHVDSTILAFYNVFMGCNSITPNSGNLDAPPQQNMLNTSEINIYNDCLQSNQTVFYLIIYYRNFSTELPQKQEIFFQYHFNKNKEFLYSRLTSKLISTEFKRFLSHHGIMLKP